MSIRGICTGTVVNIIIDVADFLATILVTLVNRVYARRLRQEAPQEINQTPCCIVTRDGC